MVDHVAEIKSRIDILEVVGQRVQLKPQGRNHLGLCPFHAEKTPSFSVSSEFQSYRCFGCGAKGDVFEFLMQTEGLTFVEAMERLAARCGISLKKTSGNGRDAKKQRLQQQLTELLRNVADWYVARMDEPAGKRARAFLDKRGIDQATSGAFGLGFAPPGNALIRAFGTGPEQLALLEQAGLAARRNRDKEEKPHDFFRNRLMFPIHDRRGRVVAFGGRRLDEEKAAKYLNSPETAVFSKRDTIYGLHQAMRRQMPESFILVEGYMDVIALAQFGWHNAVAVMGTSLNRRAAASLFRQARNRELILCFDGDAAGLAAAQKALMEIAPELQKDRQLKVMLLPDGQDPDSILKSGGAGAFRTQLQSARKLSEYLTDRLEGRSSPEEINQVLMQLIPLLEAIPPTPYRALLVGALERASGLNLEAHLHRHSDVRRPQGSIPVRRTEGAMPPDIPMQEYPKEAFPTEEYEEENREKHPRLEAAVVNLLASLQVVPDMAGKLWVFEELKSEDAPSVVQLAAEFLQVLKEDSSWERARGRLFARPDLPDGWQGHLDRADRLSRSVRPGEHMAQKMQEALQGMAEELSDQPLKVQLEAHARDLLSQRARKNLQQRLRRLRAGGRIGEAEARVLQALDSTPDRAK